MMDADEQDLLVWTDFATLSVGKKEVFVSLWFSKFYRELVGAAEEMR